jgi:hypothetical protein
MQLNSRFAPGDKAWCYENAGAVQRTVGLVRVELIDSPGIDSTFSNYAKQNGYTEQYMCIETGIGSGSVYTLGEHIFATEAECLAANAGRIERAKKAQEELRQSLIEQARSSLAYAQRQLLDLGAA